ncbi:serine/arginine repetitive matrix protein 2 isoform X2 [Nasonia vitripennis]|uniref:Protein kinase domain-containing protein n=1 Tax=Nasonia vitripennis TaxID=7425 RepID=A0A7M7PWV5_NASVI|nr:serine/arginine repetitive matrix protein 2 isoform X2 [Nasonia vitripennis]
MVVGEASIHNIMGGMESTGGVRLHNHKRKLKQRFDIIKKLGQGTYGKVQLGINKETGQEVAIKTIKKCKIETEADLIRIRREIQIMSSVQHPNIIHIYEVFENREKMVLVMEYAAGGELYDYLSERKVLSEQEARRIFRQISTAVFYCHKHKICHRDLKLENILLDQNGNAKIADFGLSNVFDEQRLLSTFCGSPLYASPEIVKGRPYHGPEVDCWSLGVLLYTLVYGAMPFDGSHFNRLVKQISQSDYFEPKKPSPASPLIKDMLTVCPSRRADIEKICAHWWVNEGYEQSCLDIAEDLAAQTPVRLDLLLSLVPQSASAEQLVVGGDQAAAQQPAGIANSVSSETLVPTRCHSVGSLMELDQNNSDRRIREMVQEEEPAATAGQDAGKRKLETTPSAEETSAAGLKRKERTGRKDGTDDRDPRAYRSASKHHSAPIPNSIIEEAMEVDPVAVPAAVPTSETVEMNNVEEAASCLEVKQEQREQKSPSKERSKTPVIENLAEDIDMTSAKDQSVEESQNRIGAPASSVKSAGPELAQPQEPPAPASPEKVSPSTSAEVEENKDLPKSDVPKEKSPAKTGEAISNKVPVQKESSKSAAEAAAKQQPKEKKTKNKALSLDCDLLPDESAPKPSTERRRSKIFETAEKFNQLASPVEPDKPKKIFIPGVNVGGAKAAFERKASLTSATIPQTVKAPVSKVIIDVPSVEKKPENDKSAELDAKEKERKREEEKRRAVEVITGALGKPPMQRKASVGSPPISPQSNDPKKLGLKIPVGPNDVRNATVTVSTPTETKFPFESEARNPELLAKAVPVSPDVSSGNDAFTSMPEEPKKCSKMEITLKSATLPRPRKTSKAEITLSGVRPVDTAFRSEVEAKIDAFQPQKLRTQRSEVAFPVAAAVPQSHRSSSLEPEGQGANNHNSFKERIIPIQVEPIAQQATVHSTTPPPKPPMPQRSLSQRSNSLSRQSTADSDTDSALGSIAGPEPIRKSPREYIIPIAVEGGGYVTPRSGSVEPESKNSTPTSTNPPRSRFGRPSRMGSLLSDASEDESPFPSLHRDNDDLLQRHMHRLRSSRPSRQAPEHADSLSSGEEDDDDGFELLTAENLFSTLLSRVRSLTQRLNVGDNTSTGFPNTRLLGRLGSNSPQGFWGIHEPLSRRIPDSQFRRSMSRDNSDRFSRKETSGPNSPGSQQNSPGARTPSRDSLFEMGNNTLPRAKSSSHQHLLRHQPQTQPQQQQQQASRSQSPSVGTGSNGLLQPEPRKEPESLEQNLTPCLARRLSRQFIEKTRQSLPRSPSLPRERSFREPSAGGLQQEQSQGHSSLERFRSRSHDRGYHSMRRANSLLEPSVSGPEVDSRRSPRRSISLFDDEDRYLPPLGPARQPLIASLGRKYRDSGKLSTTPIAVEKIQEEQPEELGPSGLAIPRIRADDCESNSLATDNNSLSECLERTSSRSAISGETSPTESTSNILDYSSSYKNLASSSASSSRELQNRLLAAENLIKESTLKNLGPSRYSANLSSNYKELDKCDKESLGAIAVTASAAVAKRRSCIPSLRLRSGSLTRDSSLGRSKYAEDSVSVHGLTPERSLLSKFFRSGSSAGRDSSTERLSSEPHKQQPKQRRISRFLRPDFFDTPREESQYVKDKEAQKAAENERRKSRFMRRKTEPVDRLLLSPTPDKPPDGERLDKELKNEVNSLTKGRSAEPPAGDESKPSIRNSFLQSLERKLEKFRSTDDASKSQQQACKPPVPATPADDNKALQSARESSVPPSAAAVTDPQPQEPKRATSAEDLSTTSSNSLSIQSPPAKSKVNSVLGLFKNSGSSEPKSAEANGAPRSQGQTILSRLRKNAYKGSRSDSVLSSSDAATSKIPTKFGKSEPRPSKKVQAEPKKPSPEKSTTLGFKRSPSKDKDKETTPPKRVSPESKKPAMERLSKTLKKSPEKLLKGKTDKTEKPADLKKDASTGKLSEKKKSPEKSFLKAKSPEKSFMKAKSPDKSFMKAKSPEKLVIDNKQIEDMNGQVEEMGVAKLKKKLATSPDNGSSLKSDKSDGVKKVKKVVKAKEPSDKDKDKDGEENTKKKRIVRVVRKVVKKSSDSSDSKSEDKEKPTKTDVIKKSVVAKKDKSPETPAATTTIPRKSPEDLTPVQSEQVMETAKTADTGEKSVNENAEMMEKDKDFNEIDKAQVCQIDNGVALTKPPEIKPCREKLKLDFSKIPQHNFRNVTPPRRESPKSENAKSEIGDASKLVQRSQSDDVSEKLSEALPKLTHRAIFMGNRIVVDKPLMAKDIADLKTEANVDGAEISESASISNEIGKENCNVDSNSLNSPQEIEKNNTEETKEMKMSNSSSKDPISTEDLMSPTEDTESFDSWSICSADINHTRGDLHSPTSPTYSMYMRGNNPNAESVIDRIRRKSFYSRFNDRKRKASLNAPPPGVNVSSSMTLPRKFSFNNPRDSNKEQPSKAKTNNYTLPNRKNAEKCYSMYNEEVPTFRKSPIERDRYSDGGSASSYNNDLKSPGETYGHISSSYDPLRKNSSLTDSILEPSTSRNISSLPRRYGSSLSGFEPKTVAYYEELLAPNHTDYLGGRRASPLPHENYSKYENGYHNGSIDLPQFSADKWKSHAEKSTKTDPSDGMQIEDRARKVSLCFSEPDNMSSSSLDQRATTSTAE